MKRQGLGVKRHPTSLDRILHDDAAHGMASAIPHQELDSHIFLQFHWIGVKRDRENEAAVRSGINLYRTGKVTATIITSGYSGRYIAKRLLDAGHSVITLTHSPQRKNPFGAAVVAHPAHQQRRLGAPPWLSRP